MYTSLKLLLVEWSHHTPDKRIGNVRITLYSIINSTTGKQLLSSFHLNGHIIGFHPQTQK